MKRLLLAACAGLLAVTVAAPSFAADLPRPAYKAPAYIAPVFTWSGFYVGINGGYGFGTSEWSAGALTTGSFDTSGWLGGGTLGFNLQTGVWVFGLEGDFDYTTMSGSAACGGGTTCQTRINWLATARGRIGYAFDRFLPYITGGAAFGNVRMGTAAGVDHDMQVGWVVGAGLEYAFLGAWSAKAEYNYVDLGTATCGAPACGGGGVDVSFHTHIVKAGLNYRF
jgi:outer membrane immunogenic protein